MGPALSVPSEAMVPLPSEPAGLFARPKMDGPLESVINYQSGNKYRIWVPSK